MLKRKIFMMASAAVLCLPAVMAQATSTNVHSTATFRQAITLNETSDLAFDKVDYANSTVTGSDTVTIAPAGTATYAGNFTAGNGAVTTAGNVNIASGDALPITVECSATATLADGTGSHTIQVTNVNFDAGGGHAGACNGSSSAATNGNFTIAGGGADNIKIGGKLNGGTASGGTIVSGSYSTQHTNGADIVVNVFYQ